MKKNNKINDKKLYNESKRLFKETMEEYIKYWIPLFIFGLSIILLLYFYTDMAFQYGSWAVVLISLFATSIFLVIFDGAPARKIRKGNFAVEGMPREKGIVFYNALKLRTIFRGLLNGIGTIIAIALTTILMVI